VPITHLKSNTVADFIGTVTVLNSTGGQVSAAATNLVRPSDWNSAHQLVYNLAGNTAGTSQASGTDVVWAGGTGITLSVAGSTISINGPTGYTALTYMNRQPALTQTTSGQNVVWLVPMRLAAPVSAVTVVNPMSLAGASSSNTGSVGITHQFGFYSVSQTTNLSRFDSFFTTAISMTGYISSSNSAAFTINGGVSGQNLTTASANSNLLSQISGLRLLTFSLSSVLQPGLYAYGFVISTSSVGNSAAFRSYLPIVDAQPLSAFGLGFGGATNASIGIVDAGSYSATSGAMPANFAFSDIIQVNNLVPLVKLGAV
jgi:hypothetical protein